MKKSVFITSLLIGTFHVAANAISDMQTTPYYIYNAASEFKIDDALMLALCTIESRCRPHAVNHDDAREEEKQKGVVKKSFGLFQIQVETAEFLGFERFTFVKVNVKKHNKFKVITKKIDHVKDLLDPEINSWYAAKYLNHLYRRYHKTVRVISAYNAGHPVKGNQKYVFKVLKLYAKIKIDNKRKAAGIE